MFQVCYVVWALLPIALLFLSARAFVRQRMKCQGKEYVRDVLPAAIYAAVAFVIAVGIDQLGFYSFIESLTAGYFELDGRIVKWLIYPAVLVVMASVQHQKKRSEEFKKDADRRARRMRFSQSGF